MKFNELKMRWEECRNYGLVQGENIIVNMDDDLNPVSYEYDATLPIPNSGVTITTVKNGFLLATDDDITVVKGHDSYYLGKELEELLYERKHYVKPFDSDQWEEDFTDLTFNAINGEEA